MSYLIPYEKRFGQALPQAGFPLPIPSTAKIPPKEARTKRWGELLDFAEKYVQLTLAEPPKAIPRRFFTRQRNPLIASLQAKLLIQMGMYASNALANKARATVLHTVRLARAEDWAQHVVNEYSAAFERCCLHCDALRRGHLAEIGEPLVFSVANVEETLKSGPKSFVGLVDYAHIRKIARTLAQDHV